MSEEITLNLPISTLDELHCFISKGYLSCSPVRLLPNGKCICGHCYLLDTDAPIHRLVVLEAFLSKMSFTCVFKKYGCSATLLFGKTADHESKCVHKPVACPVNTPTTCSWEGVASHLLNHFKDEHSVFLKDKVEFNFELDKDVQDVLMVTENTFVFIVKYFYIAKEKILKYDVRLCTNKNECDVFYKMQLRNGADADCYTNLKMKECFSYDESFCGLTSAQVLNINKYLGSFDDPDRIVVALKLVIKPNNNIATTANDLEVNFDVIKTPKCYKCRNYLVPPLFDLDGETICCVCGKKPAAKKAKSGSDSDASEPTEGDSEEEYSPKKSKPPKTRKLPPKKKKGSESDSDEDWAKSKKDSKKGGGGSAGGAKRGGSGYTKTMNLSPELAALVGQNTMARHLVVKKVWSIIKERDLYDPKNKQFAICDYALFKVIGVKRFRTFSMRKYLEGHFIS